MPKSWGILHSSVAALELAALLALGSFTYSTATRAKQGRSVTGAKRDELVVRTENPGRSEAGRAASFGGSTIAATDERPQLASVLAEFAVGPPKAEARFEGIPSPGRRILLHGEGSIAATG